MKNTNPLQSVTRVKKILKENDQDVIVLEKTVFYPQGGGQPSDIGIIFSDTTEFTVNKVLRIEDEVYHFGDIDKGLLKEGDIVKCQVGEDVRMIHSRLHSAGHIIDLALKEVETKGLIASKGFHFPEGPYVEYQGELSEKELVDLIPRLEKKTNELILENRLTSVRLMSKKEAAKICNFGVDLVPTKKNVRVVFFGDFGVPCGGTHVMQLADIGKINIRKIKSKKGKTKISYEVLNR